MSVPVLKIKKTSSDDWYELPVPMAFQGGSQVIDTNSGRDSSTGVMYRNIIREDVSTCKCTLPEGIDNVQMVEILNIILAESFQMYMPDIRTGTFTSDRVFYLASAEPEIEEIDSFSPPSWTYKEFTFSPVEL